MQREKLGEVLWSSALLLWLISRGPDEEERKKAISGRIHCR